MLSIPESDWKILHDKRGKALNRLCSKILAEIELKLRVEKSSATPHDAYLQVYKFVRANDKIVGELFNDWRRHTVFLVVSGWLREGLLTRNEFNQLSEDTRKMFSTITEIKYFE